jgi:hypothetical protein
VRLVVGDVTQLWVKSPSDAEFFQSVAERIA